MENSIYLALSRQSAMRADLNIVSNNIANMNTTGFRGQNLVFEEFIAKPRGHDDPLSFVANRGQYDLTDPGPVQVTANPLNIALEGPGFISIQGPGGEIHYSRNGDFARDPNGILITQNGFAVASSGGGNITIPEDSLEINIDRFGVVSNQDGVLGQIGIFEFENPQTLKPMGNNLYDAGDAAPGEVENTVVQQFALEGSNVNPITEMTRMIEISRQYVSVQNLLNNESERLRGAIQTLTQTN